MSLLRLRGDYWPSYLEMEQLNSLQDFFRETYRDMYVDCKFDQYQFILRRQQLADRIRDKWTLIQGSGETSCHNESSVESC